MSGSFRPRLDILPAAQRKLWPSLAPLSDLGFVLYGGTAIALRLGHRPSVDFDFFHDAPLDRLALGRALPALAQSSVIQDEPDTLTALFGVKKAGNEPVKISFFGGIDIGRVGEPQAAEGDGIVVASLDDLMATKLKVMLQRVEMRDYRDIAALLGAGVSLAHGLGAARALFGSGFQPSESLKALNYFEGGDLATLDLGDRRALVAAATAVRDIPGVALRSHRLS